ncbi:unnamed protein product [Heterobilharzia americana]|nr:unnamed protein product [Heterobilharzia americana]
MFRRHRPNEISTVKSRKKFLSDKESAHKIKHLKILIDNLPNDELQPFFVENSSLIFQVFSDCFFGLEWDIKLRGSGSYVKDLDVILTVFEVVSFLCVDDESLVLLQALLRYLVTESIKVEWSQLRYEQHLMQLWFLFEKLKHSYLPVIFPCLSPSYSVYSPTTSSQISGTVSLASTVLQDYPIHLSRLSYYQLEVTCWLAGFVYSGPRGSSHAISSDGGFSSTFTHGTGVGGAGASLNLGGVFPWDTHGDPNDFLLSRHIRSLINGPGHIQAPVHQRHTDEGTAPTTFQESASQAPPATFSKSNIYLPKDSPSLQTSVPQKFVFTESVFNYNDKVVSMVHEVLYGCRQNIDLMQDILHQALLLPLECHKALYSVTTVYGSWLENKHNRPIFMQPLDAPLNKLNEVQKLNDDLSTVDESRISRIDNYYSDLKDTELPIVKQAIEDNCVPTNLSVNKIKPEEDVHDSEELKGCLQNTIQIMLENMANVFYATSLDSSLMPSHNVDKASTSAVDYTKYQIELCRLVLQIFQFASNSNELTSETWSRLLSILMDVMRKTMINTSPTNVQNYRWLLNNKLTQNLFQTLNGALLRASLFSPISSEPWDQCLNIYSKLTHWPSLIIEWKKVMRMLTSTMGKLVYGVDLSDLPQEKKGSRIKRLAASNSANRARPKSLTEAVLNYAGSTAVLSPPVPYPSALSVLSVHENSFDDSLAPNCGVTEPDDDIQLRRNSQDNSQKYITYHEVKPVACSPYIEKWTFETVSSENAEGTKVIDAHSHDPLGEDESISLDLNDDLDDDPTTRMSDNHMHVSHGSQPHSHVMLTSCGSIRSNTTAKDKTLVSTSKSKPSVRRATSEITLTVKSRHFAPRVQKSKFDPTFSSFTRGDYQRQLHSEVPHRHHLSDSLDILTTIPAGALADRFSHPVDVISPNSFKHEEYCGKSSNTHHSGSRTSTAISCVEDDSFSLNQNGISTSSYASGEEAPSESIKFELDSPNGLAGNYFSENHDEHDSDVRKSSDIVSDEHSNSAPNRRNTLTAAATATDIHEIRKDASKIPLGTSNDQLNAIDLPRCILAGGPAFGWTHESIIVCWRRFLGVLGSFHEISNPSTLVDIFHYLNEMTTCLLKIRDYQAVPNVTELCVQPLPPFIPPVDFIAPVLFESMNLSEDFVEAKQIALRTLSDIVVRCHDGCPDPGLIAQFYRLIHRICVSKEEKYLFEVIRSCNMRIFVSSLPSTHLLILDFLSGVNVVLANPNSGVEIPRSEAISVILSLLCYPHHFGRLESIESTYMEPRTILCTDLKSQLVQMLSKAVLSDPSAEVRCLAITGLSIYCVIELMNQNTSGLLSSTNPTPFGSLFFNSIVILLGMMRFQNRIVAIVAVDMIEMLADYCYILSSRDANLASLVLLSLAWTLYTTWDNANPDNMTSIDKKFFLGLIQAISEWSMRIPYDQLLVNRETKSESILPSFNLLGTLIEVLCFIISNDNNSQSLTNLTHNSNSPHLQMTSSICFTDPLVECLSFCQQPIDINLFHASKTGLDLSSMTFKSLIVAGIENSLSGFQYNEDMNRATESVRLAARMTVSHLLNHLDQFPMSKQGVQINTSIQEHHDRLYDPMSTQNYLTSGNNNDTNADEQELTPDVFEQNNLQVFVLDRSIILTFISLPIVRCADQINSESFNDTTPIECDKDRQLNSNGFSYAYLPLSYLGTAENSKEASLKCNLVTDQFYTRIITRDLSGKYSWDASYLYGSAFQRKRQYKDKEINECASSNLPLINSGDINLHLSRNPPPCPPPRMNPPPLLNGLTSPTIDNVDRLNDVLRDLSLTSPECSINWNTSKLSEYELMKEMSDRESTTCLNLEKMTCDQITSQCRMDEDIVQKKLADFDVASLYVSSQSLDYESSPNHMLRLQCDEKSGIHDLDSVKMNPVHFENSRHLLNQLGYLSWRHRPTVELLQKSPALVRELKHLDNLGSRETHKLAIFYVGAGQEDKQSILSNQTASLEFENFVAGLGWEIDLLNHKGFRGGLERSGRAGLSTPYFVTSTLEVIFHVSTRMPSSTQEDLKYKHLGNDEIMIIWNENSRAFRRSVLRTQFGDVLIIISPLLNGLYRVEVRRESQVGLFGPIVENAVLSANVLPGLVRATAINASRAVRAMKPGYHHPYEDRAASLQQIVSKYTLPTSFEKYAETILLPNTKTIENVTSSV